MVPRSFSTCVLLLMLSVPQNVTRVAYGDDDSDIDGVDRVKAYANASRAIDASVAGERVFPSCNTRQLDILKQSPLTRVALRAAFEPVVRSVEPDSGAVDERAVERFLGFVEGRLRVSVPDWWQSAVNSGTIISRDRCFIPGALPDMATGFSEQLNGCWVRAHVIAELAGDDVVLSAASGERCRIAMSDLQPDKTEGRPQLRVRGLEVVVHKDIWAIAAMTERGHPFNVILINQQDGRLRWKNLVWAAGPVLNYGGRGILPQYVEIRVLDDRVVVWGGASDAAFCEMFDVDTGEALVRFSTSY